MRRAPTEDDVTRAIDRWLQALGSVRVGSVSALIERHGRLGCRVQSSMVWRGSPLVGLRLAEAPMRDCTQVELQALALRYSGSVVVQAGWIDGVWREQVIRGLRPYDDCGAALGCSARAARSAVERGRCKVLASLREDA